MAVNERQYNMNVQQIRQILISGPDKFAPPEQISTGKNEKNRFKLHQKPG